MTAQRVWLIRCTPPLSTDQEWTAIGAGVSSVMSDENGSQLFFSGEEPELAPLLQNLQLLHIAYESVEELPPVNWVQQCKELMTPVKLGMFTVRPIADEDPRTTQKPGEILLRPGSGFGTGHHPATRLAAELLLQNISTRPHHRLLDFGVGSGILSLLAAAVSPELRITGVDNDSLALENTRENFRLNGCIERIELVTELRSASTGCFDLIVANIYSGVLLGAEQELAALAESGAELIISGILEAQWTEVSERYSDRWTLRCRQAEDGWCAGVLTRNRISQ